MTIDGSLAIKLSFKNEMRDCAVKLRTMNFKDRSTINQVPVTFSGVGAASMMIFSLGYQIMTRNYSILNLLNNTALGGLVGCATGALLAMKANSMLSENALSLANRIMERVNSEFELNLKIHRDKPTQVS